MVQKNVDEGWAQTIRRLTEDKEDLRFIRENLRQQLDRLEKARALLETLVSFTDCAMACLDRSFCYVFANQAYARACGCDIETLWGNNHFDLYPDSNIRTEFEKVLQTGSPVFSEACPIPVWSSSHASDACWNKSLLPVKNEQGEVEHLLLSLEDVTRQLCEKEHFQRRLAEAEKLGLIGRLATNVIHEASSPLQTAMITLGRLEESGYRESSFPEELGLLKESFESIHKTITGLLDLYRPSLVKRRRINVNHLVQKAVEQLRVLLRRSRVKVNLDLSPQVPELTTSPHQLTHCLLNIFINAIEAISGEPVACDPVAETGTDGQITVRSRLRNNRVEIAISDNGPGFDPDKTTVVFDPFYSDKQTGLGIGLTRCRELVEREGGRIIARNNISGGAVVSLFLPLDPSPDG